MILLSYVTFYSLYYKLFVLYFVMKHVYALYSHIFVFRLCFYKLYNCVCVSFHFNTQIKTIIMLTKLYKL